jgi:hypothetical protein
MKTPGWQFSVRDLLALTTFVSIGMAVGIYFAGLLFGLVVLGAILAALLLSADWLIRPQNRHLLALVTVGAWFATGSGLVILGIGQPLAVSLVRFDRDIPWKVGGCVVAAGIFCFYIAARRWRRLTAQQSPRR